MKRLTNYFVAGLLAMLPTVASIYVIGLVFRILNGFGGRLQGYFGIHIPGLGVLATILLILLLGAVATNVFGRKLVSFYDGILQRVPGVKQVYSTVKQLVDLVAGPGKGAFRRMVLVEWPAQGIWTMGYMVSEESIDGMASIFVPTPPNPASGFIVLTTPDKYRVLDMSLEEGTKFIVSCGMITHDTGAAAPNGGGTEE